MKRFDGTTHGRKVVLDLVALQEASANNFVLLSSEVFPTRFSGLPSISFWMVNRFVGEEDSV